MTPGTIACRLINMRPLALFVTTKPISEPAKCAPEQYPRNFRNTAQVALPSPLGGERVRVRGERHNVIHAFLSGGASPLTPALSPPRGEGVARSALWRGTYKMHTLAGSTP